MNYYYYGNQNADTVLIQLVGDHDLPLMEQEYAYIRKLVAENDATRETIAREFLLIAVLTDDWNIELSPWNAPPVFGKDGFGNGAAETLAWLLNTLIPELKATTQPNDRSGQWQNHMAGLQTNRPQILQKPAQRIVSRKTFYIGGYSLAGLFALWAAYQTDLFAGLAAVSPSVWFPGFREYVQMQRIRTPKVYLSLGDKEEKTRSQVMARVGSAIRDIYELLVDDNIDCTLEWNPGNHFAEPDLRMAKGWTWLLSRC